jgi:hypothetical protein
VSRSFCKVVLLSARGWVCRCLALARGQPCPMSQDVSRRHNTVVRSLSKNRLHARISCRWQLYDHAGFFLIHLHPRKSPIFIPDSHPSPSLTCSVRGTKRRATMSLLVALSMRSMRTVSPPTWAHPVLQLHCFLHRHTLKC